tara:strand:- start:104 stop:343 length:240 start_codon:yes stop_codon:yes gene_type:complete
MICRTLESEHMDKNSYLKNILREHHKFGFKTAIDDLVAGYSGTNFSTLIDGHLGVNPIVKYIYYKTVFPVSTITIPDAV